MNERTNGAKKTNELCREYKYRMSRLGALKFGTPPPQLQAQREAELCETRFTVNSQIPFLTRFQVCLELDMLPAAAADRLRGQWRMSPGVLHPSNPLLHNQDGFRPCINRRG